MFGSKRNTTTNYNAKQFSDDRELLGNTGNVGGNVNLDASGNTGIIDVTTTDFGAVEGALSLGESAIESVKEFGNNVLVRQSVSNQDNLKTITDFATQVETDGNDQLTKVIQNIVLAVVALGGVVLIVSRAKK